MAKKRRTLLLYKSGNKNRRKFIRLQIIMEKGIIDHSRKCLPDFDTNVV